MAKVICKGTVIQEYITTVLVDVAQVETISMDGVESETVETRTLDGGAGITHTATGYYEPGNVSFEIEYDPALAGHQAITDIITVPAETTWKIIYADAGTTEHAFSSAGVGFGVTIDPSNVLKASISLKLTINTLPT